MSLLSKIKAATSIVFNGGATTQRQKARNTAYRSFRRDLTAMEMRNMSIFGIQLYAQMGEIRGAIKEKAKYVVGNSWIPQFMGADKEWGNRAEEWAWNWMQLCDIRGSPYNFKKGLEIASISIDRSGDIGCLLTEASTGYPMIQWISPQMIGSRSFNAVNIEVGPYKGLRLYNGVVINPSGTAVAYHVMGELPDGSEDQYISARDMMLIYDPDWCEQSRGLTALYHAILNLQDIQDIHGYTMAGIKMASTIGLVEYNEDGEAVQGSSRTTNTGDSTTGLAMDVLYEGTTRFYKSGSGSKVEVLNDNRPSPNVHEFVESTLRSAYQGIEWPYEFTRDASKLGGQPMRVILAKCGRTVENRQALLCPPAKRILGYAISKAIKNGDLPANKEWYKWEFQMPRLITGDAGREALQDREDMRAGIRSLKEDAAERGLDWQELRDQISVEAEDVVDRAQALADKKGISFEVALNLLQQRNPNGIVQQAEANPQIIQN